MISWYFLKILFSSCVITASFAPICFAIKAKENDMLPLEKNRVRLDDDSDEDKVRFSLVCSMHADLDLIKTDPWKSICQYGNNTWPYVFIYCHFYFIYFFIVKLLEEQGLEAVMGGADMAVEEPPPVSAPEEKRPSLTLEELEAKQGNVTEKKRINNNTGKYLNKKVSCSA